MKPSSSPDHPALRITIDRFREQERSGSDPVVAILGPPNTGKTALLRGLLSALSAGTAKHAPWKCVSIDLRQLPSGGAEEMYHHVLRQMVEQMEQLGVVLRIRKGAKAPQFDDMIEQSAKALGGRLVLAVDHFNHVPLAFAQELSERLRGLKESTDDVAELGKMGLVIAGSLSLHKLSTPEKSAFHLARIVRLPISDAGDGRLFIRNVLSGVNVSVDEAVVDLLFEETRGDPCYVQALVEGIDGDLSVARLEEQIERLTPEDMSHTSQMELHWYQNTSLRSVVSRLLQRRPAPRRSNAPDIDEHELTGVVVMDPAVANGYSLRNSAVRRLMESLDEGELPESLLKIEGIRKNVEYAADARTCCIALQDAWNALTPYSSAPNLEIVFVAESGRTFRSFQWPEGGVENAPAGGELARSSRAKRLSITFDASAASVVVPLRGADAVCRLLCSMERPVDQFTEFDLQHWAAFVQSVSDSIAARLFEHLYRQTLLSSVQPDTKTQARAVSRVILADQLAVVATPVVTLAYEGKADRKWAERVSRSAFIKPNMTKEEFAASLEAVGDQVEIIFEGIPGLQGRIAEEPTEYHWVVSSSVSGLKIPVELLHLQRTPLCIHTGVARQIIGYVPPPDRRMPFEVLLHKLRVAKTRLRVLLVGTDPYDELPVGVEIEKVRETLRTACTKASMADPEIVEIPSHQASSEKLGQMLSPPAFHIFHFAGHGFPDHLLLNDRGQPEELSSVRLSEMLRINGTHLCFLSACDSGRIQGDGLLTSSGMIENLLSAGVPNLIAFRWPVSAKSSRLLAEKFYIGLLAPGRSPVEAMWGARQAARATHDLSDAWASSVLITQCPG